MPSLSRWPSMAYVHLRVPTAPPCHESHDLTSKINFNADGMPPGFIDMTKPKEIP